MKKEKIAKRRKEGKNKENKTLTIRTYLRDFLLFLDKNIIKTTGILFVVAILLLAISLKGFVVNANSTDCVSGCIDSIKLLPNFWSKLQVVLVTALAGLVPYIYAPVVGFLGQTLVEVSDLSYVIKESGYFLGVLKAIAPILLNYIAISVSTALGMYICRTVTVGYKISNIKNMNITNFRIKVYEILQKEEKVKELTIKRDEKIKKLEDKKDKINYLQVLNTALLICIIQFISALIQSIIF